MEEDGNHGHLELLDDADDRLFPFTVLKAEMPVVVAHRACREEAHGLAAADKGDSFLDAFYRDGLFGRVVARALVDGYEVGAQGRDVVEYHIDHHLEAGTAASDDVDERDAVDGAERMVAYGDEGTVGEIVEHALIVNPQLDVEILEETAAEGGPGSVEIVVVDPVDLVDGEQFHSPAD